MVILSKICRGSSIAWSGLLRQVQQISAVHKTRRYANSVEGGKEFAASKFVIGLYLKADIAVFAQAAPEPSFSSMHNAKNVVPMSELTFQPHHRSPAADEQDQAASSMWDHEFSAPLSYAAAHASKAAGQWKNTYEPPSHPSALERSHTCSSTAMQHTMPIQQHSQPQPPQAPPRSSASAPVAQAHQFSGERLWSMQTPAAVAANAAVAAAAEAEAAASFTGPSDMRAWHGQSMSPPSAGGIHGHRGSPIVEAKKKELKDETDKMRLEREHVAAIRANMQQAQQALDQERLAFEAHKVSCAKNLHITMCV